MRLDPLGNLVVHEYSALPDMAALRLLYAYFRLCAGGIWRPPLGVA